MAIANKQRHLLIDGDVIAYQAAAAAQNTYVDSAGWARPVANQIEGEAIVENLLHGLKLGLGAAISSVYLSDAENWRMQVDATYKQVRVDLHRPLILSHLKEYLVAKHQAIRWPGLEADDVLGILATGPQDASFECVVVGRDKDFKSIPGKHHTLGQDRDSAGRLLVRDVSQWEADRFHLLQTLAGDRVDGYYGCPGIGMDRAATIIDAPMRLVPTQGVKTRGVNKGDAVTRWMGEPTTDLWACIVSHYQKAGLGEEDALRTARLARILRHGEYNLETEEVTLWTPEKIAR